MIKKTILLGVISIISFAVTAQSKYKLSKSEVIFHSYAPLEDIEAENKKPVGIVDKAANKFTFRVKMKDFVFPSELMEEHFNENYLESEKFPTSTYKGGINGDYDFTKNGTYNVVSEGDFMIHGVTKKVKIPILITVDKDGIHLKGTFKVALEDYDIEIPTLVFQKIAEVVDVEIKGDLIKLK